MSDSVLRSTRNEIATNKKATVVAKLPLLINQTKIVLPNSGAIMLSTPMAAIPTYKTPYVGCRLAKTAGTWFDLARA